MSNKHTKKQMVIISSILMITAYITAYSKVANKLTKYLLARLRNKMLLLCKHSGSSMLNIVYTK